MLKKQKIEIIYKYVYLKSTRVIDEIMRNLGLESTPIEYDDSNW